MTAMLRYPAMLLTATVVLVSFMPLSPARAEPGSVGVVGCSNTANAVHGYQIVSDLGELWDNNLRGYSGNAVVDWAQPGADVWGLFDSFLAQHPTTTDIWWEVCVRSGSAATEADVDLILDMILERLPTATVHVSPLDATESCTNGDPIRSTEFVEYLVANGRAVHGPIMTPLEYPTETSDGCHANSTGAPIWGQDLVNYFDLGIPPVLEPGVSIVTPAAGATVAGVISIEASVPADTGVASVDYLLDGVVIGSDADGTDGWTLEWDTSTTSDGTHELAIAAVDGNGDTGTHGISLVVQNEPVLVPELHIGDIDLTTTLNGSRWWSYASVFVADAAGLAVDGATVTGSWTGGTRVSAVTCVTDADGWCTFPGAPWPLGRVTEATFSVTGVELDGAEYQPLANTDPDLDTDGTTGIAVAPAQ